MSTVKNRPEAARSAESSSEDARSLETRFGLVMYGGVSLAIYINGVAREFFRAVRGAGVYKLIKALTDRDVVVDVISGTSAGGINGIMLAYALCNRKDFASCAALWRLDGDVRSLLRSPQNTDSAESLFDSEHYYQPRLEAAFREMPDYVEEEGELNSRFTELDLFITGTDVDGEISTQFDDAGHPIDVKDHRSLFLLKHREGRKHPFEPGSAVDGPSTPETTYQALAKLSRITSCFPAAFTPVNVSDDEPPGNATRDGKLRLWGGLAKDSSFLDGGVIDNKPFTYTIREIFGRSADRIVERKLFYVEPDPEHFKTPEVASRPNFVQAVIASLVGIPGYESIADDLRLLAQHNTKVQRYKRLRGYLEREARDAEDAALAAKAQGREPEPKAKLSAQERELYDRCSLIALSERFIEGILKMDGKAELLSRKHRERARALIEAFDDVQEELRRAVVRDETGHDVPVFVRNFNVYFRLRRLYHTVYKIVEVLGEKNCASEKEEAEIKRFTNLWRVLNREIEMLEIVRAHMERLIDNAPIRWKEKVDGSEGDAPAGEATAEEARVVWDVVTEGLLRLVDRRGGAAKVLREAFDEVRAEIEALDRGRDDRLEGFSRDTLTNFNKELSAKAKVIISDINDDKIRRWVTEHRRELEGRSQSFESILQSARKFEEEVIRRLLPVGGGEKEKVRADRLAIRSAYDDFSEFDKRLFPIEFVAELHEKDVIETIRVSPLDAERGFSNKGLSDKVSGDALYHFAGFFKRSWRSNDILWGRLDSLCQLTETLLTPEKIERVLKNRLLRHRARDRFFTPHEGEGQGDAGGGWDWVPAMRPSRLFPHAGPATQADLSAWLKSLLLNDDAIDKKLEDAKREGVKDEKVELVDRDDFAKTKIARIIEAAQLEVIYEDLPGVITDALEEQARWNQFRYPSDLLKSGARAPEESNGDGAGKFDPTVFPPVYLPAGGRLDPFASVLAAAGAASDAMRSLEQRPASGTTPMDTGVGQFFSRDYRIGSEALLRDLPPLVLLEIVSTSLLVVRNCLLKVLGGQAERIRKQPLFVFGVDLPLRAFHTLVRFMRRVPDSRKQLPIALGLLSLLLLFVGVAWFDPIVWTRASGLRTTWFFVFIVGPVAVFAAWGIYLFQGKVQERGWWRRLGDALLVLMLVAPFAVVSLVFDDMYGTAVGAVQKVYAGWFASLSGRWPGLLSLPGGKGGSTALARYTVAAAFVLTYLFPLLALVLIARGERWFRAPKERLLAQLQKYFSIPEMLAIARRLDLFKEEDVHALAEELDVFDAAALSEVAKRHGEMLVDFKAEFERRLGLPEAKDPRAYREAVATEGRKVRYAAIIEIYNKVERARKSKAYDRLAAELAEIEARRRADVEARLPRAEALAEERKVEAVNALLEEARRVETFRTNLATASIESAQSTEESRRAGELLARRIVEAAAEHDRGPGLSGRVAAFFGGEDRRADADDAPAPGARGKSGDKPPPMLARLEAMMYSINPGAMS